MSCKLVRRAALAVVVLGSVVGVASADSRSDFAPGSAVSVMTKPSEQRKLSFPQAGIIKESPVKEGDKVQAGMILLRQDTDLDQKEAERLKVDAESDAKIEAAKADKDVKQIEYDRKSQNPNAYGASEVDEAKAKLIEAEKSVKVAEEEQQQAKIKYEQQLVRLTKMEMKAPADVQGDWIVQKIVTNVGEMADPQSRDGSIQIVKNDPLYVELLGLTTKQVEQLKVGEKLPVRYLNDGPTAPWLDGEIIYIAPVSEAGSDRQIVRLKLANSEGRAAGLRMEMGPVDKLQKYAPKDDVLSFTK
jgi:multidrug efflux pump subunit AcrA (membrane-fusion protein)